MARKDTQIVSAAGEHFVAFRLAQMGFVVAMPRGGSPAVDLLVADPTGAKTVTVQVKTAEWAMRERGRGKKRRPHHLEFPLGHQAATRMGDRYVYVFVDLMGREPTSVPVAYVVPSKDIVEYCSGWADTAKWVRWHETVEKVAAYKDNWGTIARLLG